MFRLIAMDCDGTLLNCDEKISKKNLIALKKVVNLGYSIVLASGRPFYRIEKYIKEIGIENDDQFSISFNGSLVQSNRNNNVLLMKKFKSNEVKAILQNLVEYQGQIMIYSEDCVYMEQEDLIYRKNNKDANILITEFDNNIIELINVFKIAVKVRSESEFPSVIQRIRDVCDKICTVSSSGTDRIDLTPLAVTKEKALSLIGQKLGISPHEMIAFGDAENDIGMLEMVGCGIAMGNASDHVKKCANMITSTNDNDGISESITKLLSGQL